MTWQDALITAAGLAFSAGLVPTAFGRFRPPRVTALTMVCGLTAIAVSVGSLGLWMSTAATALQLSLWGVVLIRGPRDTSQQDAAYDAAIGRCSVCGHKNCMDGCCYTGTVRG